MAKKAKVTIPDIGVIYARFSSHNQRDVSIEQQEKACREFAAQKGITVAEVYSDAAMSGKTDRRPNFQRMIRDAEHGRFRYVIAWKSNRMGRNMLYAMMNETKLREMGVECLYVEEDFDDTAAGRFALRNMMNVNQFYSENMAEDILRGLMDNANKCMVNGPLPLGYQRGEDGRYAINEAEAKLVREVFEKYLAGMTLQDIQDSFNERGLKTKKGGPWNKGSFHRMLTNEKYIGNYSYNGVVVENGVPPIISKEDFYTVQRKLKEKKAVAGRKESGVYLLTGKLFCGHCGSPMVGISGTSKTGSLYSYYVCQKRLKEKACKKKNVSRDWIEMKVAEAAHRYILKDEVMQWIADGYDKFREEVEKDSALAAAKVELKEVEASIENVMGAIEQGIYSKTTRQRLIELEGRQEELRQAITIETQMLSKVDRDRVLFWLDRYKRGDVSDPEFRAELIKTFIKAVYLYDDKLRVVFDYTGEADTVALSIEELDELAVTDESSYKLSDTPPNDTRTNTIVLYRVNGSFILELPL